MPERVLSHTRAPRIQNCCLETGNFLELAVSDQFLIDLEFISRHSRDFQEITCVYPYTPPYLHNLSDLFPNIHFIAFRSLEVSYPDIEYDPEMPYMDICTIRKDNITHSPCPFTKKMALELADRNKEICLLFVCHSETQVRQLAFHILMQPNFSLFDMTSLPPGYIHGELILPIGLQQGKCLIFLHVTRYGKEKAYHNNIFHQEMGYFQTMGQYNAEAREFIIHQFARRYQEYDMMVMKMRLVLTVLDLTHIKTGPISQ